MYLGRHCLLPKEIVTVNKLTFLDLVPGITLYELLLEMLVVFCGEKITHPALRVPLPFRVGSILTPSTKVNAFLNKFRAGSPFKLGNAFLS